MQIEFVRLGAQHPHDLKAAEMCGHQKRAAAEARKDVVPCRSHLKLALIACEQMQSIDRDRRECQQMTEDLPPRRRVRADASEEIKAVSTALPIKAEVDKRDDGQQHYPACTPSCQTRGLPQQVQPEPIRRLRPLLPTLIHGESDSH